MGTPARSGLKPADLKAGETLFGGDMALFVREVAEADVYAEYGCGQSTLWVLEQTGADSLSVDSNPDWVRHVGERAAAPDRLDLHWADLGPVGDWGWPRSYAKRANFADYTDWLWQQDKMPDTVLIDGRFRVCCFLTTLKYAAAGTTILFDDYAERGHYHIVEEFLAPAERCGRQALFVVPRAGQIDPVALDAAIAGFRLVMD